MDCFIKTARNDGPLAFYNGFMPNFARLGSWNIAMFLMLEQVGGGSQSIASYVCAVCGGDHCPTLHALAFGTAPCFSCWSRSVDMGCDCGQLQSCGLACMHAPSRAVTLSRSPKRLPRVACAPLLPLSALAPHHLR